MNQYSHQALSVGFEQGSTTVEGFNSLGQPYALEIRGPHAKAWHDVLRRNVYKRDNQNYNVPPPDEE